MFLTIEDQKLNEEFIKNGFIIRKVENLKNLYLIKSYYEKKIKQILTKNKKFKKNFDFFNNAHKYINAKSLNEFRIKIIKEFNEIKNIRQLYFSLARTDIERIVGNELSMQRNINLSIQLPNDDSSLLPIHSDRWSGDSSFEIVLWIPLVDCYNTKSMYLLPPQMKSIISRLINKNQKINSDDIFKKVKSKLKWMNVKFGEFLIFNQNLPHGNTINNEIETRWSMNCRFKGIFTPYGDKKIGEFFEPITLRAASIVGMEYDTKN